MTRAWLLCLALSAFTATANAGEFYRKQTEFPRVQEAEKRHLRALRELFLEKGAAWPPSGILLQAFKLERTLELWAEAEINDDRAPWVLIHSFPVCGQSGTLGPKRYKGDRQVPEGAYRVSRFNPRSTYHLALGVSYPNQDDRKRTGNRDPGGDIMIHGDCVTTGCIPITDQGIEQVYLAAILAKDNGQRSIPIYSFPCRMDEDYCRFVTSWLSRFNADLFKHFSELAKLYDLLSELD